VGWGEEYKNIELLNTDIIRKLRKIEQELKWGRERFLNKPPSGLLIYPEEGDSTILRNIRKFYRTKCQHNQESINH
jgi:hypothetical protein